MKLKDYVTPVSELFAKFEVYELHYYIGRVVSKGNYSDLECRILWDMWCSVERATNYALFDEIMEKHPDTLDSHMLTMLKAAFKQAFGCNVYDFYTAC